MEIVILVLLFVVLYLWIKTRKLEKEITRRNDEYQKKLSDLQNEHEVTLKEKNEAILRTLFLEGKVQMLQKSLTEAEKAVDFYKKMCPERTKKYEREIRIAMGHLQTVQYIAAITI